MSRDGVKTVALIGYGYWGPNLLRNYMDIPDVKLKWVCDLRPEVLDKARRRYPTLRTTTSVDDVLRDPEVDSVLIATPIGTHYHLSKQALLAAKHVFVEKPLTSSAEQCVDLTALAAERNLTLMVGHTFIYSPPVRKIKDLIDAGELGEVRFVTMQRVNLGLHQKDASVIWDLAAHDISILDYWLGEMPSVVGSMGRDCMRVGIPDVAFLNLQYRCGVVAHINVSWLSPVKLRDTVVVGSRKMLVYDDTAPVEKVKVFDQGADFKEPESFAEFQMVYRTGDIVSPKIENAEPLRVEAEHFLHCMRTGGRPVTDGEMGLRVVAALAAADASLREGARKAVERRCRPDRRVLVVAAREAADLSLQEGTGNTVERLERRRRPDRRLRVVAALETADFSTRDETREASERAERRHGTDRRAADALAEVAALAEEPG